MSATLDDILTLDFHQPGQQRAPARYSRAWILVLVMVDALAFLASSYIAGGFVDHAWTWENFAVRLSHSSWIFILLWAVVFERLGLYRRSFALSTKDEFYYTVVALVLGVLPQFLLFTVMPAISTSRLLLALSLVLGVALVGGERAALHALRNLVARRRPARYLIVGSDGAVAAVEGSLEAGAEVMRASRGADWLERARAQRCTSVILTENIDPGTLPKLLATAVRAGITVSFGFPQLRCHAYTMEAQRAGHQLLLLPKQLPICRPAGRLTKRLIDLIGAAAGIILTSPIVALAALAVLLDSGAPIIFSQDRVGKDGLPFRMYKFRTMRTDAGSDWAKPGDARITRVGAFLRRTSIDELPQFVNILRGEMSIVGPRPEMRSFAERFAKRLPRYDERHLVKPGVTGWAQVSMKRNLEPADAHRVLSHDLFYIEHWSAYLDVAIIFKTVLEVLFHRAV